tara:strand:- start:13 stop:258 length:246 start_codon:yes stop_codon:yes gene_type:complete
MIKIWLLVAFMSAPGWPSVRTQAFVYPDEGTCVEAQVEFFNAYESKPESYKNLMIVDSHCLPFESFAIPGWLPMEKMGFDT